MKSLESLPEMLLQIAEAESFSELADVVLRHCASRQVDCSLYFAWPDHVARCTRDRSTAQLTMTTLASPLPRFNAGRVQRAALPKEHQKILGADGNDSLSELFVSQGESPSVLLAASGKLSVDDGHLLEILLRGIQARASALHQLDEARQQSTTDELTGLPNRRYFVRRLNEEVDRAARHQRHLALIILDLDQLKQLNDCLGHQSGDDALRETAARLRQTVRRIDTVCRYAGDEFCIIMPDAGAETCQALLRRLHSTLNLTASAPDCPTATISMGGAVFPADATDTESLFQKADDALRQAKLRRGTFVLADRPAG